MQGQPTLIQIQQRYIGSVLQAEPRYRALVRGAARGRALRALRAWGFTVAQAESAIDDARAIEVLEREAGVR